MTGDARGSSSVTFTCLLVVSNRNALPPYKARQSELHTQTLWYSHPGETCTEPPPPLFHFVVLGVKETIGPMYGENLFLDTTSASTSDSNSDSNSSSSSDSESDSDCDTVTDSDSDSVGNSEYA